MLAFAGWVIGYDGHFEFDNINDDYHENKVPYVGLRALPASLGSLTPPIVYGIMRESGYPRIISFFSAALLVFGVSNSRLNKSIRAHTIFFSGQIMHILPIHA